VISALVSTAVVGGLYDAFVQNASQKLLVMFSTRLVPVSFLVGNITIIFLALGISIGAIGSIISMRRFLDT